MIYSRNQQAYALPLVLGALPLFMLCGSCSSGAQLTKARVKLTFHGKTLPIDPKDGVTVIFIPIAEPEANVNVYPANIVNRDDLSFLVPGREGRGIPVGKYRIAVSIMMFEPTEEVQKLNDMFTRDNTAIVRDITNDEPIILDLAKTEG